MNHGTGIDQMHEPLDSARYATMEAGKGSTRPFESSSIVTEITCDVELVQNEGDCRRLDKIGTAFDASEHGRQ